MWSLFYTNRCDSFPESNVKPEPFENEFPCKHINYLLTCCFSIFNHIKMCIRSVDDEVDPTDLYTESELKEEYDSKHTEPTLLVGMTFDFIFLALPIY